MEAVDVSKKTEVAGAFPFLLAGGLFVLIDGLALLLTRPFEAAGVSVFENPDDPLNIVFLFLVMLISTAVILLVSRFLRKLFVQGIILVAVAVDSFLIFYPLLAEAIPDPWSTCLSFGATALLLMMLVKYPEWYVVDACSIVVAVGTIAILGISLSISLVIGLLIGLTLYDAISVYKTKHMIDLADIVFEIKAPVMLVIPKVRGYSQIRGTRSLKEQLKKGEEREGLVMGLGDFVFPGILVVSAFYNLASSGLIVAECVLLGTLLGLVPLSASMARGKPQAGLPYLCGGAVLGYLISSYFLFGHLVF